MFGAIGRWLSALGYLLTGSLDAARATLDSDPNVVRAKYARIIREKRSRIQNYMDAVAGLITQQERKKSSVKALTAESQKLEKLKAGAAAMAKKRVAELQSSGRSPEEIKQDPEYIKCSAAFSDFSSTLAEKQARISELEQDIGGLNKQIDGHKVQLEQ